MNMNGVSIVVPTLNEEDNIKPLIREIDAVMGYNGIPYEIIFIDDYSTDLTRKKILELIDIYPIRLYLKEGKKGKATSLHEGFRHAVYPVLCMIDGDLQYPPSAIPKMLVKILSGADVVVAERKEKKISLRRKIMSGIFRQFFGRFLHGLSVDVQSGLKVFRKEVVERLPLTATGWSFDLEFLIKAQAAGSVIVPHTVAFSKRHAGKSKLGFIKPAVQIGVSAIKLKARKPDVIPFDKARAKEKGEGFSYKGTEYVHHSSLPLLQSAFYRTTLNQKLLIIIALELLLASVLFLGWHQTLLIVIAGIIFLYAIDLFFSMYLVYRSFTHAPEVTVAKKSLGRMHWPKYTIYCPLYKESSVLPQFIKAIENLDYPKDKLQVLLLLEEDDKGTIRDILLQNLPYYFTVLVVPDSKPKTKPKALNYGLKFTTGEYAVIYDAEDIPDPDQLKKAVIAFEKTDEKTICVQAKLKFYNPQQNLLTKLFAADYSLWFDVILPGLQSIGAPIPLGGTSNHFRTNDLKKLHGWDSFNVTEDADLGIRIMKRGYKTAIVDSYTQEEANSDLLNWFRQRSRWIKGYLQTYLVHMRDLRGFFKTTSDTSFLTFQLVFGAKIVSMLLNPVMWTLTVSYFLFRPQIGLFIESLFPPVIFYLGVFSLVIGNFMYAYFYMLGAAKQEHWENVYVALVMPFYWLGISAAAVKAGYELVKRPFYWHKTKHGLHLPKEEEVPQPRYEPQIIPAVG